MNTVTREIESQGPRSALMWRTNPRGFDHITISYDGRMMPCRRASGLSPDEQAKVRNGEIVVIRGFSPSGGTTWRQVVYRHGRYRTRLPSAAIVEAVAHSMNEWDWNSGWLRVKEWREKWDETTRIKKLMEYGPALLKRGLPGDPADLDFCFALAYKWDNNIPGDE